jgi:histidine triad (HIT) family protein
MTEDFYCDEVLSGKTEVRIVRETDNVLAYHHTRPFWPEHIVVIQATYRSLLTLEEARPIAAGVDWGSTRVATEVIGKHGAYRVPANTAISRLKHLHSCLCA